MSFWRTANRLRKRFETFAHAMRSTRPTAPSSRTSVGARRSHRLFDPRAKNVLVVRVESRRKLGRVSPRDRAHLGFGLLEGDAGLEASGDLAGSRRLPGAAAE